MAIRIKGSTVIDDSENIIADGTISGGIVATTAEAQAGTSDSVIMTPLKVKNAIQGGTISVIKSVQRFTLTYNGTPEVFNLGQTTGMNVSSSPAGAALAAPGGTADYTFVTLPTAVNINKSFLTVTVSGAITSVSGVTGNTFETVQIGARFYNSGGGYAGNQVQLISSTGPNYIYVRDNLEIYVEVVEFY